MCPDVELWAMCLDVDHRLGWFAASWGSVVAYRLCPTCAMETSSTVARRFRAWANSSTWSGRRSTTTVCCWSAPLRRTRRRSRRNPCDASDATFVRNEASETLWMHAKIRSVRYRTNDRYYFCASSYKRSVVTKSTGSRNCFLTMLRSRVNVRRSVRKVIASNPAHARTRLRRPSLCNLVTVAASNGLAYQ